MLEWLKNLEPEFMILFATALITIILLIITVIRAARIHSLIGKRALDLSEDLIVRDEEEIVEIVMSNTSYIDIQTTTVGILYKKNLLPIKEENITIYARDSYRLSLSLTTLRKFVIGDQKKIKKIYVYAEDSLARRTVGKAKNSYRRLRSILKAELKAEKLQEKNLRFETGKFNFGERVGLVLKTIFSPITNLCRIIRNAINRGLKNREVKQELKKERNKARRKLILEQDEIRHEQMKKENEEKIKADRLEAEQKLVEEEKQRKEKIRLEKEEKERQKLEQERLEKEQEKARIAEEKRQKELLLEEEKRQKEAELLKEQAEKEKEDIEVTEEEIETTEEENNEQEN